MNGRIPDLAGALLGAANRSPTGRSAIALAVALSAGALALIAPPLALLALAMLGARALMQAKAPHINFAELAGPVLATIAVGAVVGLAGAVGVLFAWRVIADARWSVNEAQRLALAAGHPGETTRLSLAHAWLTPLYGLTLVAFTSPHLIAGLPLDLPHVPAIVTWGAGLIALGGVFDWALKRAADWRLGDVAPAPAIHLLTHHALFVLAFGLTLDVSAGIVATLAWRLVHAAPFSAPFALSPGASQASLTAVP